MDRILLADQTSHPHFIGAWQLTIPAITENLIEYFYAHESRHQSGITSSGTDKTRKDSTDLQVEPVDNNGEIPPPIRAYLESLNSCYQDYLKQWPFVNSLGTLNVGSFNIQKYGSGGHFQRLHSERTTLSSSHRVLAFMTYLNTLTDEGETVFEYYGIKVTPKEGLTLIWPAEWTHAHIGSVVKTTKYIITGWFHFPPA